VAPEHVALWQRHFGHQVSLINAYGVSEATITSLLYRVPPEARSEISAAQVPIGRPIANVRAYVLDKYRHPVPVGVPGELYLGGDGLALGYLNQPELTRERFVLDPFDGDSPGRLYQTGDRARYLADGNLEVLGRLDQQVKVHGFRIEPAEVESALTSHPGVREAVVAAREETGHNRLVGYVVPDRTYREIAPAAGNDGQQVNRWLALYDEIYGQNATSDDPTFNTVGWNSTYTGLAIPKNEMREWTNNTVARILELRPRRVLEIGCGTGLLLFRIAPQCETYLATDFSPVVLRLLAESLAARPCPQVRLLQREAEDFRNLEDERFDTIILNSVVQYFPSWSYLLRVLSGARQLLIPGGSLFIGDVRSLPLLPTYHTALELYRAPAELPTDALRQRILKGMAKEQELIIDPMFFQALGRHLPEIDCVSVQIKQGSGRNELLQFRYDVVLETSARGKTDGDEHLPTSAGKPVRSPVETLGWEESKLSVASLCQWIRRRAPQKLRISRVPNARVVAPANAWARLSSEPDLGTVGELRRAIAALATSGVEPDDLRQMAQSLGYHVTIQWSDSGPDGRYDVDLELRSKSSQSQRDDSAKEPYEGASILTDPRDRDCVGKGDSVARTQWKGRTRALQEEDWGSYTNNPIQGAYERRLVPSLRTHLKERLPEYMVPSVFVLLDALPLLPNGKVNRAALPAPDASRPETNRAFILPRTATERTLARVWEELLGLERIGIHDNFFDLGGDSILSIQIIARVNQSGFHLTPKELFQHQTIAELAAIAEQSAARPLSHRSEAGDAAHGDLAVASERLLSSQLTRGSKAWR
jgi:SAM-dependent methyltransferase